MALKKITDKNDACPKAKGIPCIVLAGATDPVYIGAPVELDGADGGGLPSVIAAAPGDAIFGIVEAIKPVDYSSTKYRVAATERIVYVNVDDDRFEVTEDGVGGFITDAGIGATCDLITTITGNNLTGESAAVLDSSTLAGTGGQVRLLERKTFKNAAGTTSTKWVVIINERQVTLDGEGAQTTV